MLKSLILVAIRSKKLSVYLVMLCVLGAPACTSVNKVDETQSTQWDVIDFLQVSDPGGVVVEGDPGKSEVGGVAFDGEGDRVVVSENPIYGFDEFTIEMKIFPRDAFPNNTDPRLLHIEYDQDPTQRITMELRLNSDSKWYMDAYIRSNTEELTLVNSNFVHPVETWNHIAVTYKSGLFKSWVNGVHELSGSVAFQPLPKESSVSLGARLNRIYWFDGNIESVNFSNRALEAHEFLLLKLNTSVN